MQDCRLLEAISRGDALAVRKLLDDGVPCTATNNKNETYLHVIAKQKPLKNCSTAELNAHKQHQKDIIYMLSNEGLCPSQQNTEGMTAIHYTIENLDPDLLGTFLQCTPDPPSDIYDVTRSDALQEVLNKFKPGLCNAIRQCSIADVRRIINMWCRTEVFQKDGPSLKELALDSGHEDIITLILGVEPSMRLVHHVLARKVEKVKEILDAERNNLNLDFRNMSDHGAPILYYAIANRDAEIARLLIMAGCHIFTLMRDCENREIPVIFSALASDMSPDIADALMPDNLSGQRELLRRLLYKGSTILEVALKKRIPPSAFEIILQRGGAPLLASRDWQNRSVRDLAEEAGQINYVTTIDKVVKSWVEDNTKYPDQRQLLAICGYNHIKQLFMKKSLPLQDLRTEITANTTIEYLEGIEAHQSQILKLFKAVEGGDLEEFEALRTCNSPAFKMNLCWESCSKGEGQPLLHRAVLFNHPRIVQVILENIPQGQSVDTLLDQHHRTALHYAYGMPNAKEIVKLLMNAGCSEHTLDRIGKEPLDFKLRCGSPAMDTLLKSIRNKTFIDESKIWASKVFAVREPSKPKQRTQPCMAHGNTTHMLQTSPCPCKHAHVPISQETPCQGKTNNCQEERWCSIL
ncbi:uncharacterized protein ISCGN_000722 [Ixodes scapularis]